MDRTPRYTQVTGPRGPFPHAGSTSPGWATRTYTQTTPLRAEVVPGAAWSRRRTRDHRPHRSKQGLFRMRVQNCESGAGLRERRALCCLVHARVHAEPSPIRSPAMISRPPKAAVGWTRRMLLLALSVVLLGTARAAGTSASSCPLDKVLISNGDSILVDALGHFAINMRT